MVRRWFYFVTTHPIPVLLVMAALAGVLGLQMFSLTRETSPDAFIPPDHPALALKHEIDKRFGLTDPLVIAVIRNAPDGIFTVHTITLIRDLTNAIQKLPGVDSGDVMSLTTESGVYFDEYGEPGFEPLLKEIPQDRESLMAFKEDILSYELYGGTLLAADGSAATIVIRSKSDEQAEELHQRLNELLHDFPREDEQLVVAGEAAVRTHMGRAVSDDALRMNFLCPIVMALIILLAYRTGRGTILPLAVVGGASAAALGMMSVFGVPVFIVTNGIFVVIMALGVADSLHIIGQYYEEQFAPNGRNKQQLIVDACMTLWYPVLITSLTDIAGFFSLYLVGLMPPIEYFGIFTCVGVLGAMIYSYTVIPAGLMILPLKLPRSFIKIKESMQANLYPDRLGKLMGSIGSAVYHRRKIVLLVGMVVIAWAVWGSSKLTVNDARILAFKDQHPIVQATRELNKRFDGTSDMNIVISGQIEGAFLQPEAIRKIEQLEAFTESLPHVGGTHSLSGWVKRAHQKLNQDNPEYYAIPEDPDQTKFYIDVLRTETSPMSRMLREIINDDYSETNLIVRMKSSEFIHQRDVVEAVQDYLDEHFSGGDYTAVLAGRANLDYHWLAVIQTSHIRSVLFSLACVLLLTGIMFRSMIAGLLCTFTVGVAVIINYAIMGLGNIPLGVGTSMFASIAIGAGVNFPIYLLDRLRQEFRHSVDNPETVYRHTLAFAGRSLLFTALVVAGGFLLLCVSEFQTLVRFGLLIGVGMISSFLVSVLLLPAMIAIFKPRFIYWRIHTKH